MFQRYCNRGVLAALLVAIGATGATGIAAQTGAVTGRVTDATTGQPLDAVGVSLEGTATSALTDADGHYRLGGVAAGAHTLRVAIPGYRTREREVTVPPGGTAVVDIRLEVSNLNLDERTGGGLAGSAERGRMGTSLPTLDAGRVAEFPAVDDFGRLLEGRIPGVRSVGTSGGVGAGRELVIRGIDSFGFTRQRPAVYIDGVRVDTEKAEWALMAQMTCCMFSGGAGEDRLSDLNPEEIDRIEVLKGPAAAALYGVEGSAGVIEVFTKRGRNNTPATFTLNTSLGLNRLRPNLPTTLRPHFAGPGGFSAWDPNETLIENGRINSHDLTVMGGGEDMTYFVSGGLTYQEGSVKPNDQNRANLRVNLDWTVADNLTLSVTSAHVRNRISVLQSGNSWLGVYTNAMLSNPRRATPDEPYGGGVDVSVPDAQAIETWSNTDRWTGRIQVDHAVLPNFTHRFTIGLDHVTDQKSRYLPDGRHYTDLGSDGEWSFGYRRARKLTSAYTAMYGYDNLFGLKFLGGSLSAGGQFHRDSVWISMALGQGTQHPWLGSADRIYGDENSTKQLSLGFFVQNRFDIAGGLSVTTAIRFDGHSAFGPEAFGSDPNKGGWASYPKLAFAYNLPRSFLPAAISTLRFRAAAGRAGKPPPPHLAQPPYKAVGVLDDKPGVQYTGPRNFEIEPENKREFETGLDIGLLDDKVGAEFTYYDAQTVNALVLRPMAASRGAIGRVENCCAIVNQGIEAALAATPVDLPFLRWNVNLAYEWNRNRIVSFGPGAVEDSMPRYVQRDDGTWAFAGWNYGRSLNGLFEGRSIGEIMSHGIAGFDPATNTHEVTGYPFSRGRARPEHIGSVFNSFEIAGRVRLSFRLRGEAGAVMRNTGRRYVVRALAHDEYLQHLDLGGEPTARADSVYDYHRIDPIDSRDHVRLQMVSLSYTLPDGIGGRFGLQGTTVTLSGYNLHWWDDCNCPDPSQKYLADDLDASPFMALPQPRSFLLSVRTRF